MRFYSSLFYDYITNYLKTKLTYRADFWIEVLSDLLFQGLNLFFILVVFLHTDLLGGWTQPQVLFIYGYFMVPYGLFNCFFNMWGFADRYIVKGEMDRVLTRPAYNLVQLILENLDPPSVVGSVMGMVIMGFAWPHLGLTLHMVDVLMFVVLVLSSVLIYAGVYVALIAISFFVDAPTGILPMVYNLQNYGRYPINIYNKVIALLLTWILPFAFVGFYPAAYFLDSGGHFQQMALLTPIVGVVFCTAGIVFWNYGVKKYQGAGS